MATTTKSKRRTAADIAAAVALGAIDPSAELLTADDAASEAESIQVQPAVTAPLSATTHECGIAGCRHGAGTHGKVQPDRQVKLQCGTCGAVARMTTRALTVAGGAPTCADGGTFAPAARRTYVRKAQ